ncbi:hypothetical protein L0B52_03265 [Suttonella sp. R2A3]|uniref:hypothetical protein n=1 Tax=Suttonella sp. R2A3 TaxID=2908648 RepID=UPI001F34B543|nr:hypothetical protein [Suttonella sp. R2A3]UJF25182.1 hypothetical protein L0B52_03265 [Suttonella sp. R2A3]
MNKSIKALSLAALAALSFGAQAKVSEGQAYGDWKGVCKDGECGITQTVNNDSGQPVGQIIIRKKVK